LDLFVISISIFLQHSAKWRAEQISWLCGVCGVCGRAVY
jgi:hypothetical protein